MTGALSALTGSNTAIVMPAVKVDGSNISSTVGGNLIRAVVDLHLHLPDMFELTFNDVQGSIVEQATIAVGSTVELEATKAGDSSSTSLIKGEVTSIEAICASGMVLSVVRGYDRAHRLQRAKRTKTYLNMTDADIARQVAGDAGLDIGSIDSTATTHDHISQVAQTDWEFLQQRAREIGYETGMSQGKFYFRKASGQSSGGGRGGALGAVASAAAGALGLGSGDLTFKDNLLSFHPRVSGANITPQVQVRVWDPKTARVVVGSTDAATGTASLDNEDPQAVANAFADGFKPSPPSLPALPPIPGLPKLDFGSAPSDSAYQVVDRPVAIGSATDTAADEMAKGLADHIASTFAEAEGEARGDPSILAGSQVSIKGVPKMFVGKWTVTNAKHIFDPMESGYRTRFVASGRSERSLLSLASGGESRRATQLPGLVCGVVTNVDDPTKKGRIKVALPWLSPSYESDWARVVNLAAGARSGAMFLPEVGDEVLVGFEFGDARRPYVLGGLINDNAKFSTMDNAVSGGAVTGRGFATPAGNQLLFTDELPPGPPGPPPSKSSIALGTGDGNLGIVVDQVAGTVTISCKPAPPKSRSANGSLTIDCSGLGQIEIKGGTGGVKISSDGQLELSGQAGVKITSTANVQVQGAMVQLN
ncbi:MAG TPA: phage baseplate assembly protein V [Jatrophihabitans sp.]|nr:phage baseplate assembly protein V [Jatrophihabitans sp.]